MGIHILKQGIADSLRDGGRFGFQHLGILPSGVMDPVALFVANTLVGNEPDTAVLEMHFPASIIEFETTESDVQKMREHGIAEDDIPAVGVRRRPADLSLSGLQPSRRAAAERRGRGNR